VRDGDDTDVHVFFRVFDEDPGAEMAVAERGELVPVSIAAAHALLGVIERKRRSLGDGERDRERKRWLRVWTPSPLASTPWARAERVYPGQVLLLHGAAGGYDSDLGWTGEVLPREPVEPVALAATTPSVLEQMDADPRTSIDRWVPLPSHLSDVGREAADIVNALGLREEFSAAVTTAAFWHDLGKAHDEFQRRIVEPVREDLALAPPGEGLWAKSAHRRPPPKGVRPYFRHELASALAWLQAGPACPQRDLVAYLIAAHHGKVRLSIRSVPHEHRPPDSERLFARGVWHGDLLPPVDLPDGSRVGPVELDLSPMLLGEGSWLERTLALRDDPTIGPFRLAYLEALVRIADWRASEKERRDA
jgi:CRISPR-associated endonuclease/helicase Cas3